MAEFIEKQKVKEAIEREWDGCVGYYSAFTIIEDTCDAIDALPPADVRPVAHGQWEDENWIKMPFNSPIPYLCIARCSACKNRTILNVRRGKSEWEITSDFCSKCGADMKEDG